MSRSAARRERGRPRSAAADASIAAATLELLVERGYAALTIEAVAERAGVTRPTVYRRHETRAALVTAAVAAAFAQANPAVPDTGAAREDVRLLLRNTIRMLRDTSIGAVVRAVVPELSRDPELRALATNLERERRTLLRAALARGVERGELTLPGGVEVTIDALLGAIYLRLLITGRALSDRLAGELVGVILPG
ncbi:MAG: TetR/AcrR family transcriptional regulator [Myxococcales bacterium]|nr:TetR/AcrR family transcriptional regulator [Myxococcales bacterium]